MVGQRDRQILYLKLCPMYMIALMYLKICFILLMEISIGH